MSYSPACSSLGVDKGLYLCYMRRRGAHEQAETNVSHLSVPEETVPITKIRNFLIVSKRGANVAFTILLHYLAQKLSREDSNVYYTKLPLPRISVISVFLVLLLYFI